MKTSANILSDIYFPNRTDGAIMKKALTMRGINAEFSEAENYQGYLGLNVKRLTGLILIMRLRHANVEAFNVPIIYRDCSNITLDDAKKIASKLDLGSGLRAVYAEGRSQLPMYWWFGIAGGDGSKAGGGVGIDRVDGHVWTSDEHDEYSHDYNNGFWILPPKS